MRLETTFKFELGDAVEVSVGVGTIQGKVDMAGMQRNHQNPRYLVEWVNAKSEVRSRWFDEAELSHQTAPAQNAGAEPTPD